MLVKISMISLFSLSMLFGSGFFASDFDYEKAWKEVQAFERDGLPASALEVVEKIYAQAKKEKANAQLLKAVLIKSNLHFQLNDVQETTKIEDLKLEINETESTELKAILHFLLAEYYQQYLRNNLYRIQQRTSTANETSKDISEWSPKTIQAEAQKHIDLAMRTKNLENVSLSSYDLLFNKTEIKDVTLREILLVKAIRYYTNNSNNFQANIASKYLDRKNVFLSNPDFLTIQYTAPKNTLEFAHKYYQELTELVSSKDKAAAWVLHHRLKFELDKSILPQKDTSYQNILGNLYNKGAISFKKQLAGLMLVNHYKTHARPGNDPTNDKQSLLRAMNIIEDLLSQPIDKEIKDKLLAHKEEIEQEKLHVITESVIPINEHVPVNVSFTNLTQLHFDLVKLSDFESNAERKYNEDLVKQLRNLVPIHSWTEAYDGIKDYEQHVGEVILPKMEQGAYILVTSKKGIRQLKKEQLFSINRFQVSNLTYVNYNTTDGTQVLVADRNTGLPNKGVSVEFLQMKYDRSSRKQVMTVLGTSETDNNGKASFDAGTKHQNIMIHLKTETDELYTENWIYANRTQQNNRPRQNAYVMTDRSIYRPGQRVYFSSFNYQWHLGKTEILANKTYTVTAKNVNRETVYEENLTTDEYGSLHGDFTIREGDLTGNYSIEVQGLNTGIHRSGSTFKVEEYKRPTFKASFDKIAETKVLGEEISISGDLKSFTDFPIQDAKVSFEISKKDVPTTYWRRIWYPHQSNPITIAVGETASDENGKFSFSFETQALEDGDNSAKSFHIKIKAVDATGETITDEKYISVGAKPYKIEMDIKQSYLTDNIEGLNIKTTNLENEIVKTEKTLSFQKLKPPKQNYKKRYWGSIPDYFFISQKEFESKLPDYLYNTQVGDPSKWEKDSGTTPTEITFWEECPSINLDHGHYEVSLFTRDEKGNEDKLTTYIKINKNALLGSHFLAADQQEMMYKVGESFNWPVLVDNKLEKVFFQKWKGKELVREKWLDINGKADLGTVIEDSDQGGFHYTIIGFYRNRYQIINQYISVPFSKELITFKDVVFSDQIKPKETVNWKFDIEEEMEENQVYQITACLYDASLDKLFPHQWKAHFLPKNPMNSSVSTYGYSGSTNQTLYQQYSRGNTFYNLDRYPTINWFGFMHGRHTMGFESMDQNAGGRPRMMRSKEMSANKSMPAAADMAVAESINAFSSASEDADAWVLEEAKMEIRKELGETVFFYPNIASDKKGAFDIQFTMNDAVSNFKLLLFAHSKDMVYGFDTREIVSKKEVLVRPNFPRLISAGDQISIPVKVENTSSINQIGRVSLDARTLMSGRQSNISIDQQTQSIQIAPGTSETVFFNLQTETSAISPLELTASFSGSNASDAEQQIIPIVSNQTLVREGFPFWINPGEKEMLDLASLGVKKPEDLHLATFELAANPMFLVLQSLPALKKEQLDISSNVLSNLQILALTNSMVKSTPELQNALIRDAIESEEGPLSKNEDLKAVSLSQSPWVQDAIEEASRREILSQYFDGNSIQDKTNRHIKMLADFQHANGGMIWIKGGRSSLNMSLLVLEKLGRLLEVNALNLHDLSLIDVANLIRFVDEEIKRNYERHWKKNEKHLSSEMIRYAYVKSLFPDFDKYTATKALKHALDMMKRHWTKQNVFYQSIIATTYLLNQDKELPKLILASLQERIIEKPDQGMYWKEINDYYAYYNNVISESYAMEFFGKMNAETRYIHGMKKWLIANKRVNQWTNHSNTAEVLHAMLSVGKEWIQDETKISISFNDKAQTFAPNRNYQKYQWSQDNISNVPSSIIINNDNDFPIFGFIQTQNFESLADVKQPVNDNPLKISKELFIERTEGNTIQWEQLTDQTIQKGDRLRLKITLENDRRLSFVSLIDHRAAGLEPAQNLSGFNYKDGLYYYQSVRDDGQHFFFETLPKGDFVFEYDVHVVHEGVYQQGTAEIQSFYAPAFGSHSEGKWMTVE